MHTSLLQRLPDRHRRALEWFLEHSGAENPWPQPLDDGTLVVTRAKGIYKPTWTHYAVSVREMVGTDYPDRAPTPVPEGTWTYRYFQEGLNPVDGGNRYTNQGLLACMGDNVPVGVLRQTQVRPRARYRVLGLALVRSWKDGYFTLEGLSPLD